jgi:hypothetical protein
MKKVLLLISVFSLLTIVSCNKESGTNATVVRDCTGTYLEMNGDDYFICNPDKIAGFSDGTKVNVSYKSIEECTVNGVVCYMYHPKKGDIEVTDVK